MLDIIFQDFGEHFWEFWRVFLKILETILGNFGHHFWGCRSHFGTSRSPFGDVFCALNSEMRNPRNGPKKGANFFGPFRGHVGMPCHETYQIGGTFQEANRPAALETYHFVRFMARFVAGHPHMPSKRPQKIGHPSWTVSWISRLRIRAQKIRKTRCQNSHRAPQERRPPAFVQLDSADKKRSAKPPV